ncbi:MAG: hypothetical protein QM811_03500 [Pirellulales bacterium]
MAVVFAQTPAPTPVELEADPFNPPELTPEEKKFYAVLQPIAFEHRVFYDGKPHPGIHLEFLFVDETKPVKEEAKRTLRLSDLKVLPKLKKVKGLGFSHEIVVTDEWMPVIADFQSLENLGLGGSEKPENRKFTSAEFKALADLPIRSAGLHGCRNLDDEAMKTIADWEEIEGLGLADVPLTDKGIFTIRGCRKLTFLDISCGYRGGNLVTETSMPTLKCFERLDELNIDGTQLSLRRYEELIKFSPKPKSFGRRAAIMTARVPLEDALRERLTVRTALSEHRETTTQRPLMYVKPAQGGDTTVAGLMPPMPTAC